MLRGCSQLIDNQPTPSHCVARPCPKPSAVASLDLRLKEQVHEGGIEASGHGDARRTAGQERRSRPGRFAQAEGSGSGGLRSGECYLASFHAGNPHSDPASQRRQRAGLFRNRDPLVDPQVLDGDEQCPGIFDTQRARPCARRLQVRVVVRPCRERRDVIRPQPIHALGDCQPCLNPPRVEIADARQPTLDTPRAVGSAVTRSPGATRPHASCTAVKAADGACPRRASVQRQPD
jgi:hypothetical protein